MFKFVPKLNFQNPYNKLYKSINQKTNMGTAIVKMKIMPNSVETNLKEIEEKAKKIVKKMAGTDAKIEEEPIAFGLKAIILQFPIDESKSIDDVEAKIKALPNVSSIDIIDFRRAFG